MIPRYEALWLSTILSTKPALASLAEGIEIRIATENPRAMMTNDALVFLLHTFLKALLTVPILNHILKRRFLTTTQIHVYKGLFISGVPDGLMLFRPFLLGPAH